MQFRYGASHTICIAMGLLIGASAFGQENPGNLHSRPSDDELKKILADHAKWIESDGVKGKRADLSRTQLNHANFSKANLTRADFSGAELNYADFRGATLEDTDFSDANLVGASFRGTAQDRTDLIGADFSGANLNLANLGHTNLRRADLSEAELTGADLVGALFEPSRIPPAPLIVNAKHLWEIRFFSPHALQQLRAAFKESGFRAEERQVTYMLKKREQESADTMYERWGLWLLFDVTCEYGRAPGRAFRILLWLLLLCSVAYTVSQWRGGDSGIWKVWPENRILKRDADDDQNDEVRQRLAVERKRSWQPVLTSIGRGFFFSLLSAFHFGWKDLDVGNWIMRIQPRECTLRATGWIKTLAGIQSVLSMYLLALWALTYFGRPFE